MMEINVKKLLENGMSPESIGRMVQMEAQKQKDRSEAKAAATAEKIAEARKKFIGDMYDYFYLIFPTDGVDKEEFINKMSQNLLEYEQILTNPKLKQIFDDIDNICNCKEQKSESKKCGCTDKTSGEPYPTRNRNVKFNTEIPLDEEALDKILIDFVRTLV